MKVYAVEITWVDPVKAGADGPTTLVGDFSLRGVVDAYVEGLKRDRAVKAYRILEAEREQTAWVGVSHVEVTPEVREAALGRLLESMKP